MKVESRQRIVWRDVSRDSKSDSKLDIRRGCLFPRLFFGEPDAKLMETNALGLTFVVTLNPRKNEKSSRCVF